MTPLREALLSHMVYDPNAEGGDEKEYTVRSIYFDDKNLRYFYQKEFNHSNRKKIRLRGYGYNPQSKVVMEIKRKFAGAGTKNRVFVDYSDSVNAIRSGSAVSGCEDESMFLYHILRYRLKPTANVVYDREPFMMPYFTENNLRVTFDKNLRYSYYPEVEGLFNDSAMVRVGIKSFILEIKFNDFYPSWLRSIISSLGLRRSPASKYAISISSSPIIKSGLHSYQKYKSVGAF